MKKRIVSMTLALALVFALSVSAVAAPTPLWDQIDDCNLWLGFTGSTANCDVVITGKVGTSMIRATVYLQKVNANGTYTLVKSWTNEVHSDEFNFGESVANCASGTYRLSVNAIVYNNSGKGEGVSDEIFTSR